MSRKGKQIEPEEPEPWKVRKFPPMSAATYRRIEKQGQMSLPGFERTVTPPPIVKKGARRDD